MCPLIIICLHIIIVNKDLIYVNIETFKLVRLPISSFLLWLEFSIMNTHPIDSSYIVSPALIFFPSHTFLSLFSLFLPSFISSFLSLLSIIFHKFQFAISPCHDVLIPCTDNWVFSFSCGGIFLRVFCVNGRLGIRWQELWEN